MCLTLMLGRSFHIKLYGLEYTHVTNAEALAPQDLWSFRIPTCICLGIYVSNTDVSLKLSIPSGNRRFDKSGMVELSQSSFKTSTH